MKVRLSEIVHNGYVHVPCNLCGSDDYEIFAQVENVTDEVIHRTAVRCKNCGLVYSNPQATRETLRDFYTATYPELSRYLEGVEGLRSSHQAFFAGLNERVGEGRFLEVGSASGHLLKVGQEMGWDVYGVELSETFSQYARDSLELKNIYTGELWEACFPNQFFDYVLMWHTLEHVPDATRVLIEIGRIMKDDGELRIGVPNIAEPFNWIGRFSCWIKGKKPGMPTSDHHTYDFTPTTLRKMLKKACFVIDEINLYYNPESLEITGEINWKGKLEKRLISLITRIVHNRVGSRMAVTAQKCT